jgi:hypothetical protein
VVSKDCPARRLVTVLTELSGRTDTKVGMDIPSIVSRSEIFLICSQSRTALRSIQWGTGVLSQRVKQPERAVHRSPSSSGEVKNEWSYTSTFPLHLHKPSMGQLYAHFHFLTRRADALNFGTWPACHGSLRSELSAWVATRCCHVGCPCQVTYLLTQTHTCLLLRLVT